MIDPALCRIKFERLSGDESFHDRGRPSGFDVLDFWRWSSSDLVSNTMRGILAEYIVAKALGISTECIREEWGVYDLTRPDGVRIEVKSAAYIQSWAQREYSRISFTVPKRRAWNPDTNELETEPRRHADVYVLALLAHKDQATLDPLDLSQWKFWAVPTALLDARKRSQHSITLASLRTLVGEPVSFSELSVEVDRVIQTEGSAES